MQIVLNVLRVLTSACDGMHHLFNESFFFFYYFVHSFSFVAVNRHIKALPGLWHNYYIFIKVSSEVFAIFK